MIFLGFVEFCERVDTRVGNLDDPDVDLVAAGRVAGFNGETREGTEHRALSAPGESDQSDLHGTRTVQHGGRPRPASAS